ncbi:MAG: putative holliday junction resolvase [Parcubacteria group bacterium Athens1014_10]|nr:MAG: putative holliday junction resolvase [Parcubacteria group bacterium Athens1014_10]TSD05477.1 MAG: putative holliday junction resolvase [Parcubacteria group bacterium Athens0714_12]
MSKIIAIDYGEKRIGLAITDQRQKIVFPYLTLVNDKFFLKNLKKICQKEKVEKIIIGLPLSLNSQETVQTQEVREFTGLLKENFEIPIIEEDERLTSKMADKLSAKNRDEKAAMIILESYLERD